VNPGDFGYYPEANSTIGFLDGSVVAKKLKDCDAGHWFAWNNVVENNIDLFFF